jgi:hypothetical protein
MFKIPKMSSKPGVEAHTCNPSNVEAGAGILQI